LCGKYADSANTARGQDSDGDAPDNFIVDCIPLSFIAKFMKGISIHGPIAAFLTRGSWTLEEAGALVKRMA